MVDQSPAEGGPLKTSDHEAAGTGEVVFYFGVFARIGGIERFAVNLLNGLHRNGWKTSLLCASRKEWLPEDLQVPVKRAPFVRGASLHLSDLLLLLAHGWRAVRRPGWIVFGKWPPPFFLKVLRGLRGGATRFLYVTPYAPVSPDNPAARRQALWFYGQFDQIVVQAASFRQTLETMGVEVPIRVIPYLGDTVFENIPVQPFPTGKPWRVGFLGRLEAQKNLDVLFDAFAELPVEAELHVYGDGSLRDHWMKRAKDNPRITFYGMVPHSDLPQVVAENHVFAFCSLEEGQVLAALEILSLGRPIAATPAGALQEILENPALGTCAPEAGKPALVAALRKVLQNIDEKRIQPERIRESYLQNWSHASILRRYETLLAAA